LEVIVPLVEFLLLGTAIVMVAVRRLPPSDQDWMRTVLLAALGIRLAAATAFAMVPALRVFHEDASGYEVNGMVIASMWRGDYPPFPMTNTPGFLYLAGSVYYLFGIYRPALSYLNCILGTLLVYGIYRLALRLFHPAVARMAALFLAFMPSMVLWSSMALKDAAVTLALVVALSSCVSLKKQVSPWAIAGIVLPLAAVNSLRFYMFYFVGFAIIVSLFLDRGMRFFTGIYKQIFLVLAVAGLFAVLGMSESAEQNVDFLTLEAASKYRRGMAISARRRRGRVHARVGAGLPSRGHRPPAVGAVSLADDVDRTAAGGAGDGAVVVPVPGHGPGHHPRPAAPLRQHVPAHHLHRHAHLCLFTRARQRRLRVPPAGADPGVPVRVRGRRNLHEEAASVRPGPEPRPV
jgi:hypothetical protein